MHLRNVQKAIISFCLLATCLIEVRILVYWQQYAIPADLLKLMLITGLLNVCVIFIIWRVVLAIVRQALKTIQLSLRWQKSVLCMIISMPVFMVMMSVLDIILLDKPHLRSGSSIIPLALSFYAYFNIVAILWNNLPQDRRLH